MNCKLRKLLPALGLAIFCHFAAAAAAENCRQAAGPECYQGFAVAGSGGRLHYYASLAVDSADSADAAPTRALIGMHGHPRDANRTFDASLQAVRNAGALGDTLVVAPVFQVAATDAGKCHAPGTPDAQPGDLLWTCASWLEGGASSASAGGTGVGSFAALDALIEEIIRRWPSVRSVTVAGFSAGGQMVQHYIAFARPSLPAGVALRYVVSDPGTWLYFDPQRPEPFDAASCPGVNQWKYGTDGLPALLGRDAREARAQYAAADIHYLEGELDTGTDRAAYYRILDKSCGAMAQGPYRLQRGQAYAQYHRTVLTPGRPVSFTVVPGCGHDVSCVFPSDAARAALLGTKP